MNLPDYERVIYRINPLVEVVCQLRFPILLKVANQDPVEFQDSIRETYPILEVSNQVQVFSGFVQDSGQSGTLGSEVIYHFKSEDLKWQVALNRMFIGLSTTDYKRYEEFRTRFQKVLEVFEKIYNPSFYMRVGMRYEDLIVRSQLHLRDEAWTNLIPSYIAPELHQSEIATSVTAFTKTVLMEDEGWRVTFRHGLVEVNDGDKNALEPAYLLDADFFKEGNIGKGHDVWELLDNYNHSARKLFRWSITEKLHLAMDPQPVVESSVA
jgi:uncharacterized protein (TIGR04255 family)